MRRMKDPYGREITNLRISVTQRCDLACFYCHREGQLQTQDEMTISEISMIFQLAKDLGFDSVKITGGEPLLRDDIEDVIRVAGNMFSDVSMTTNGILLDQKADLLASAGLTRVNVSLDTLVPEVYKALTGVDKVKDVISGLKAARAVGLDPVKVNMILIKGYNHEELDQMLEFCFERGITLQVIEYVAKRDDVKSRFYHEHHFDLRPVEEHLSKIASDISYRSMHRRKRYTVKKGSVEGIVEVVRPMHNSEFCMNCSRLRITSNGLLKPCLLSPEGLVDILTPLRMGADQDTLKGLFVKAIMNRKPYWRKSDDNHG